MGEAFTRSVNRVPAGVGSTRAGYDAELGDPNPYKGTSLALAKCWRRGYEAMLTIRAAGTPAMQQYLAARVDARM